MAKKPKVTLKMTDQRRVERQLSKQAEPALRMMGRARIAEELNGLVPEFQGRRVDEVKAAVVSRLASIGVAITDPELTQYAEGIAAGDSFHL